MEILDYAKPLIVAEAAIKRMYNAAILRQYDEAQEQGRQAIVELRMALAAINHEKDSQ